MGKKRANGEGSIDKYRNNKYRVRITIAGKSIAKYFDKHADAIAWRDEQITDNRKGTWVEPNTYTLIQWAGYFLETYKQPPNVTYKTYDGYWGLLKHLAPIADIKIQDIKPMHIQNMLNTMEKTIQKKVDGKLVKTQEPIAAATKNKLRRLLHMTFEQAISEGICKSNPIKAIKAQKVISPDIEVFNDDEIKKLLIPTGYKNEYHIVVLVGLATGMRLSEILGGNIQECMDYSEHIFNILEGVHERTDGTQYFSPPKSKASKRSVKISKMLSEKIEALSETQKYLCVRSNGNPILHSNFEKWWRKFLKDKDITHRKFHCLRHTHATKLLQDGISVLEVAARLGHSRPSVTLDIYGHACKQSGKLQLESSERLFGI